VSSDGLAGKTVLVTRAADQAGDLSARLAAAGAVPIEAPAIATRPVASGGALDRAVVQVAGGAFDWVVFTSASGVRFWFERARTLGFDARALRALVAAVGPGTAAELDRHGIVANLVPKRFTTEALARAFPRGPGAVLLARTNIATPELEQALRTKGWAVRKVVAYRTVRVRSLPSEVRAMLRAGRVDALAFTSASTVQGFVRMAGAVPATKVVCIGPVTAQTAKGLGLTVDAVASPHTLDGLVAALARALNRS
jgi:uroporphyrinogen-III synthase